MEELRAHLGEEQLNLLGHSHGGVVAIAYAAQHPEHTRRLVALDTLVRLHPEEMEEIMLRHRDEPWYDDARRALEQEDAGDYSNDAELQEITRRFWPMYFAHFDERAARYADEYLVARAGGTPTRSSCFNEGIAEWDMRPELARIDRSDARAHRRLGLHLRPCLRDDIADGVAGSEKSCSRTAATSPSSSSRTSFRDGPSFLA